MIRFPRCKVVLICSGSRTLINMLSLVLVYKRAAARRSAGNAKPGLLNIASCRCKASPTTSILLHKIWQRKQRGSVYMRTPMIACRCDSMKLTHAISWKLWPIIFRSEWSISLPRYPGSISGLWIPDVSILFKLVSVDVYGCCSLDLRW